MPEIDRKPYDKSFWYGGGGGQKGGSRSWLYPLRLMFLQSLYTVCPRSLDLFYVVTFHINGSKTYSTSQCGNFGMARYR